MSDPTFQTLAESQHFIIGHSYESVSVIRKGGGPAISAGDHYGDPKCGLITPDEIWFVSAGEGLQAHSSHTGLLTFFRPGFPPRLAQSSESSLHIHAIKLEAFHVIRLLVDPWSEFSSVWRLNLDDLTLLKLSSGPFLFGTPYREVVDF